MIRRSVKASFFSKMLLSLGMGFILAVALGFGDLGSRAEALSGSQFNAGRIIDDGVFYGSNSMSPNDIQVFLNSKVPECDANGTKIYSGTTTRAEYGASRGYAPPYICLKDYSQAVPTVNNGPSDLCTGSINGGNKSASVIIYEVSMACGVSPKVLIVLLQKEQSLVTDEWPWSIQYRSATGYGCPDSGACDSEYYGFFNQVYQAAKAYKRYRANPANYNYRAGRNNTVLWHPNGACGNSSVYIDNQSTAGLYIYTPYRPNQAALDNLYGSGDGCSSYGNRNFWRMFSDWFGSTYAPSYSWQIMSQYASTDDTKTTPKNLANLLPGEKAFIGFTARNTGNVVWSNVGPNAIVVGTIAPMERSSRLFTGSGWLSGTRPTALKESSVAPGEIGTFEFWVTAPTTPGSGGVYNERFGLVASGITWFNDTGLSYYTNVQPPTYSWQMMSQYSDSDMANLRAGSVARVGFTAKNTGNVTWKNTGPNPIRVGTLSPIERTSIFAPGSNWLGPSRMTQLVEASVPPGGTGTFEFAMTTPNKPGTYNERFGLVAEGVTWLNDLGLSYYARIVPDTYSWQMMSQYSDSDMANLRPGDVVHVGFTAKNTGNITWTNNGANPIRVGTLSPIERTSIFAPGSNWLGPSRTTQLIEASVPPGGTGTFEFILTVPSNKPGVYNERFGLVAEGRTWLNDLGLSYYARIVQ